MSLTRTEADTLGVNQYKWSDCPPHIIPHDCKDAVTMSHVEKRVADNPICSADFQMGERPVHSKMILSQVKIPSRCKAEIISSGRYASGDGIKTNEDPVTTVNSPSKFRQKELLHFLKAEPNSRTSLYTHSASPIPILQALAFQIFLLNGIAPWPDAKDASEERFAQ